MRKAAVAVVAAAALMAKANAGDDFGYHMADGSSSAAQPVLSLNSLSTKSRLGLWTHAEAASHA